MRTSRKLWAACAVSAVVSGLMAFVATPVSAAPDEDDTPLETLTSPWVAVSTSSSSSTSRDHRDANATDDVQDAFKAFTRALQNTGRGWSRGVLERRAAPLSGLAETSYTPVTTDSIATTFDPYIEDEFEPDGSTNWEDGFRVRALLPP